MFLQIIGGIILVIVLLFLLVCLLRVNILVSMQEITEIYLQIGPVRRRLFPLEPFSHRNSKKEKKPVDKTIQKSNHRFYSELSAKDYKDLFSALCPTVCRAINQTCRRIRISPFQLTLTLGGKENPAEAAEIYGFFQAGVWSLMPALEQYFVVSNPFIHLDLDFQAADMQIHGRFGISARIGDIVFIGFGVGISFVRWFIRLTRLKNEEKKHTKKTDMPTEATT